MSTWNIVRHYFIEQRRLWLMKTHTFLWLQCKYAIMQSVVVPPVIINILFIYATIIAGTFETMPFHWTSILSTTQQRVIPVSVMCKLLKHFKWLQYKSISCNIFIWHFRIFLTIYYCLKRPLITSSTHMKWTSTTILG